MKTLTALSVSVLLSMSSLAMADESNKEAEAKPVEEVRIIGQKPLFDANMYREEIAALLLESARALAVESLTQANQMLANN